MTFLRLIVRLVGFLLFVALALTGAAVAIFSIQGGDTGLSIPALADLVGLPDLGQTTDDFRAQLEAEGAAATRSALGGLAAIALGVVLLVGALAPTRERLLTLEDSEEGRLAARGRPLSQFAKTLTERVDGVTDAKVKARAGRFGHGHLKVRADRTRPSERREVCAGIETALEPVSRGFGLRNRISTRVGEGSSRVQ
ncbi:MAG TPA: DUF6286 domain-containing protein [Thermoleophilaceae bacterium]|nr:DUF6286 domain-containing protein [Thermoleophilaceae bacterium]